MRPCRNRRCNGLASLNLLGEYCLAPECKQSDHKAGATCIFMAASGRLQILFNSYAVHVSRARISAGAVHAKPTFYVTECSALTFATKLRCVNLMRARIFRPHHEVMDCVWTAVCDRRGKPKKTICPHATRSTPFLHGHRHQRAHPKTRQPLCFGLMVTIAYLCGMGLQSMFKLM